MPVFIHVKALLTFSVINVIKLLCQPLFCELNEVLYSCVAFCATADLCWSFLYLVLSLNAWEYASHSDRITSLTGHTNGFNKTQKARVTSSLPLPLGDGPIIKNKHLTVLCNLTKKWFVEKVTGDASAYSPLSCFETEVWMDSYPQTFHRLRLIHDATYLSWIQSLCQLASQAHNTHTQEKRLG